MEYVVDDLDGYILIRRWMVIIEIFKQIEVI